MRLAIQTPKGRVLERETPKVLAEAENGFFCLLPRHVDFAAALVAGILAYEGGDGEHRWVAVDEGTLVKKGDRVDVAVRDAVEGADLGSLEETVRERFLALDERERAARTAIAKLEADFVRRTVELSRREGNG